MDIDIDEANRLVQRGCDELKAVLVGNGYRDPSVFGFGDRWVMSWRKHETGYDIESKHAKTFAAALEMVRSLPRRAPLTLAEIEATLGVAGEAA